MYPKMRWTDTGLGVWVGRDTANTGCGLGDIWLSCDAGRVVSPIAELPGDAGGSFVMTAQWKSEGPRSRPF